MKLKKRQKWSLIECINIQCNAKAKELTKEQAPVSASPCLLFVLTSPILETNKKT